MRSARQKITRVFVSAVGLFALLLLLCLDSVDYRPYFRSAYYAETIDRLKAATATNLTVYGELEAGFGRAKLTPVLNVSSEDASKGEFRSVPLAGYGNRKGAPASGIHDDVFVKAVALRVANRTCVMFGADALIVPREVADTAAARLMGEFGLARAQLYFSATHTHSSLGGWGEGFVGEAFAGKFNPATRTWFAGRFVAAAREALADF